MSQPIWYIIDSAAAVAAVKSLQFCLTLWDPIDRSPPGSPVPGILQARTLEWVAISFSSAWKWTVKVKSLCRVWLFATPWNAAYQAPLSMGFSRQEYWSGVPLPSPILLGTQKYRWLVSFWVQCPTFTTHSSPSLTWALKSQRTVSLGFFLTPNMLFLHQHHPIPNTNRAALCPLTSDTMSVELVPMPQVEGSRLSWLQTPDM